LRLEPGASVFGDTRLLADRVRGLAGVAEARVVRHLPAALTVELREVEPAALTPGPRGTRLVAVDAVGPPRPLDPARSGLERPIAGSGDSGVVGVLALIQSVDPALFQTITGARRLARGDVLLEVGSPRVLVRRDAGPEVIRAVVLVAQDRAARGRSYFELDARFGGQVVVRRKATARGRGDVRHRGRARLGACLDGRRGGVGGRGHGGGRGAGERGGARRVAGPGPRAAARHPAGVCGRPAARHLGSRGDDGDATRGRDVPGHGTVDRRAEPAPERGAGALPPRRPGARAAGGVVRRADRRRAGAGRRAGGGGWRLDGCGDLP